MTVDDQGPGIDPADLPHVFERFYRSRDARSMPGSGLGLAIVHQVVERHAGAVTAGSAPGGGARLSMWLPGHPVPGPRPAVRQPLSPPRLAHGPAEQPPQAVVTSTPPGGHVPPGDA
jgi:two-component system sensor histidine kinase MprB